MVNNTAYGGLIGKPEGVHDTSISLTEGQWTVTHTLPSLVRYMHTTWQIPEGVVLLGGAGGLSTQADLIRPDSSTELLFNSQNFSRYTSSVFFCFDWSYRKSNMSVRLSVQVKFV